MVGFQHNGSSMVSNNEKFYRITNAFKNGSHHFPIDILDSLYLFFNISFVRGLIRGFNMDIDYVMVIEKFDGFICFTQVIGIKVSGRSFNNRSIKSCQSAYAFYKVYCCYVAPVSP